MTTLYNPNEHAHWCLELCCPWLLPSRVQPELEWNDYDESRWFEDYLRDLDHHDFDGEGRIVRDTNSHGNGFFVSAAPSQSGFVKLLRKACRERLWRCVSRTDDTLADLDWEEQAKITIRRADDPELAAIIAQERAKERADDESSTESGASLSQDDEAEEQRGLSATRQKHITDLISACDVFVVFLSPRYQDSRFAMFELAQALKLHKYVVPVCFGGGAFPAIQTDDMPKEIRHITPFELLPAPDPDGQADGVFTFTLDLFRNLAEELIVDLQEERVFVRAHTKLLLRAQFWINTDFDDDKLLYGRDCARASHFLSLAQVGQVIAPTMLHHAFINASLANEKIDTGRLWLALAFAVIVLVLGFFPEEGAFYASCIAILFIIKSADYSTNLEL